MMFSHHWHSHCCLVFFHLSWSNQKHAQIGRLVKIAVKVHCFVELALALKFLQHCLTRRITGLTWSRHQHRAVDCYSRIASGLYLLGNHQCKWQPIEKVSVPSDLILATLTAFVVYLYPDYGGALLKSTGRTFPPHGDLIWQQMICQNKRRVWKNPNMPTSRLAARFNRVSSTMNKPSAYVLKQLCVYLS